ncbi:MAG TPA: GNAT family N-acetyltransferase [Vicinamibacteria bacterium]|nr:GNAT family N-acetyltransferase [Vicinamibacteria bacterium]
MPMIDLLDADAARREQPALIALLRDVVDDGGSVGFLPPLSADEAREYWESVAVAVKGGGRLLWVAREDGALLGTVQLDLEKRANGNHRAELIKLMVHTSARRRGVGRALMRAAQDEARRRGRRTLVLDTRQGDPSEALYRSLGWSLAGAIPQYARSANGELHATALYYLLLGE